MLECGSKLDNITSCIGPCIGKGSYKINNDFFRKFIIENSQNVALKKFYSNHLIHLKIKKTFLVIEDL